ncbi:hypothetical protein ACQKEM_03485 [Pseudomonas sp. NPDC077382]
MQARIASKLAPTGAGETIVLQTRLAIAQAQADFVGASLLAIRYGEELMGKQLGVALAAAQHISSGKKNLELRWGRGKFEV